MCVPLFTVSHYFLDINIAELLLKWLPCVRLGGDVSEKRNGALPEECGGTAGATTEAVTLFPWCLPKFRGLDVPSVGVLLIACVAFSRVVLQHLQRCLLFWRELP